MSLIAAVPWIGSMAQLLGLWALERVTSLKSHTLRLAAAARALWLIPLAAAPVLGVSARWFELTTGVATVSAILASSSSAAWMAWVRELVPAGFRGRFFGLRLRFVMAATIAANVIGAAWVSWRPAGIHAGLLVLGVLAVVCAGISTWLLSLVARAPGTADASEVRPMAGSLAAIVSETLRDERFRSVLVFGAMFNGSVQMASSYFPFYFTRDLGLPISTVAGWTVLANVGWFVAAVTWGRVIDRSAGGVRSVLFWTGNLIAICPFYYVASPAGVVSTWLAPVDYFTNGVFWAGYTLAWTKLLLEACPKGRSAVYFSVYAAAAGLAGAVGSLLGGWIAQVAGFQALFLLAGVLRLCALWAWHPRVAAETLVPG